MDSRFLRIPFNFTGVAFLIAPTYAPEQFTLKYETDKDIAF